MRRAFLPDLLSLLAAAVLTASLSGCSRGGRNSMTLGDWISLLDEKAGISQFDQNEPYFMNISTASPYYAPVQAAVEWKVLETNTAFDPYAPLTREWTAYTLINLAERNTESASDLSIRDLRRSRFPKQVSAAVSSGLMTLDSHNRFHPDREMTREEAYGCLEQILAVINNRSFDTVYEEPEWNPDIEWTEEEPESVDEDAGTAVFPAGSKIKEGQYFTESADGVPETVYQIVKKEEPAEDEKITTVIAPAKPEQILNSMEAADSFTIDFSEAEIIDNIDGSDIAVGNAVSYSEPNSFMMMRVNSFPIERYQKSHTIKGYKVTCSVTSTGIRAEVSKQMPSGMSVFADLRISSVTPSYRWKMKDGTIQDGYFALSFQSSENLGAKITDYRKYYGDFSKVDPKDFLGTVRNLFQRADNAADIEIPVMTVKVPVPSAPTLTITMQLQLRIYSSGRAELSLVQDQKIGMEIRNGKIREIRDFKATSEAGIHASTSILGGLKTTMNMMGMSIADILTEAGVKAQVSTTVHAYDKLGNHTTKSANDVPADMVEDLVSGKENVLVCADISAYKVADIKLNSSRTLAGRLGLSKNISVFDEHNGRLIPGLASHMENGHFVDHCTRGDRLRTEKKEPAVESDQIRIAFYSMILEPGETRSIQVTGLPHGHTMDDLVFRSEDSSIASADGAKITGVQEGSTIIHVTTMDGGFDVSCTVVVRNKT